MAEARRRAGPVPAPRRSPPKGAAALPSDAIVGTMDAIVGEELSSLRAYKLKTDGILGEMMERMRRDAEERAGLERALAVAQHSSGDLAARHEAAGRRLVGTMDALREAEEREAGMAAALEQQRQHESALVADLHGARRQLYEQQQRHAAAKAAAKAAAAASPARDSLGGGEQLAEQLAAARARIVELERGTRAGAARETEAAAAAEAAGAEHQRRHAQAGAVGAALRGAVADLQGALKQAQAALCAERAARASAGQQAIADMGSALGGEGGAFSATSAAAAAEAWGKEDPEGTWQQQEQHHHHDAAALAGTDASAAAEAAMAAVERGASPPPTSHADSSVFFFFHMTVQAALAEAAGRSTRLGCNTPVVDSEAMFREATAQSDMLAMHEWPQWIRAKVQARFQTAALSGGSEAPGSEAPSDVSGGAGWGSDRESEDGTGCSAAEQGSDDGLALARAALAEDDAAATGGTEAAEHRGGSRMAAAAEAALQDVSGFICPVCYDTFASADTLLAHHGTHRALMLLHTSSDESSGDESDHSFSRAPAERVYTSMRDLQMAGDLDALGDGPHSPLSSPSVTPPDSPSALLRGLAASAQTLTETFGT